jgi:phage repressor protein C with HTH and peptisase S24 domain
MQQKNAENENNISTNLDLRLKEAVKLAGGPAVVAAEIGVGISTIYNYLKLKPSPPIDFVYKLGRLANVRPSWLFIGELPRKDGDETGDWETHLRPVRLGEKRIPILDVAASAGHGLEVFDVDPESWATFPLDWLMGLGNPDEMSMLRVEGDSMEPELRDGDHVIIDRSQVAMKDGLHVVATDDHLFLKRLRVKGRGKAELVSTNPKYPPFEVEIADDDDISQLATRIVGRVVWAGGRT